MEVHFRCMCGPSTSTTSTDVPPQAFGILCEAMSLCLSSLSTPLL